MKSKEAPMRFYYKDLSSDKNELEVFEQEDNFLISFENFAKDIFERPKMGRSLGMVEYELPQPNKEELEKKVNIMLKNAGYISEQAPEEKVQIKGFMEKVKSWFS